EDSRSKKYAAHLDNLEHLYKDSSRFHFNPVSFNSESTDFSPAYYKDGLVFVSGRAEHSKEFKWDESSFLDLYQSAKDSTGNYSEPTVFYKKLNSRFHEGPISFFTNGKSLVYTRSNFEKGTVRRSSDGVTKLKLYFTVIDKKGNWSKRHPYQYNSDEYSVGHPAISNDGLIMYFISDMPGGYGGTDIYVSKFDGRLWSVPENMGSEVNTKGNEMFPFLHNTDVLYFASNGHGGLGGLDIYKFDLSSRKLNNIGYPLNSEKDDFGLIMNAEGNQGFMSSNRNSQNGMDNIYNFGFLPSIDIYYETGKWEICHKDGVIELLAFANPNLVLTKNICDKGPPELDEIIKLLIDDASLAVALSSNGDLIGDDAYNLTLSEKRARAATEYLIAQGISPSRILKSDVTMAQANKHFNSDESTELDQQTKGRTEFKLLKYNP
ncbi:MAG: PD40 domain-containing protein, partial [Cyclobacteriaceae bacterium]|nr:PD40 domain-containing protein [Cyclobacteriaceae bacterium]